MGDLNLYDAGQQSYVSGTAATTLFSGQQSVVRDALNVWTSPSLKYLAVTREVICPTARFPKAGFNDSGDSTDPAEHAIACAYYCLDDCLRFRTAHYGSYTDTQDATTLYPSGNGPSNYWGYWESAYGWTTDDPWDIGKEWLQTVTFLDTTDMNLDMDNAWDYALGPPGQSNARAAYNLNLFFQYSTDLNSVPPSSISSDGSYSNTFIAITGSYYTDSYVTNTVAIQGVSYPGNGHWPTAANTVLTWPSFYVDSGLQKSWSPPIGGYDDSIYAERVQVKFDLPISYTFFEVICGVGGGNGGINIDTGAGSKTTYYFKMRGVGILNPETVVEIPQPNMFSGNPMIFSAPDGTPLCATHSVVFMLVNQTIQDWLGVDLGGPFVAGDAVTQGYLMEDGTTLGSVGNQPNITSDNGQITADSGRVTADSGRS